MSGAGRAPGKQRAEAPIANASPFASHAAAPASLSRGQNGVRSAATDAGRIYVEAVLGRYLWLPGTPVRSSRHDRRLAKTLYEGGVPLTVIHTALLLGAARRVFRSQEAPRLPPIRTLHYFLPLIDEVLDDPPAPDYAQYLEGKVRPLAEAKLEGRRRSIAD